MKQYPALKISLHDSSQFYLGNKEEKNQTSLQTLKQIQFAENVDILEENPFEKYFGANVEIAKKQQPVTDNLNSYKVGRKRQSISLSRDSGFKSAASPENEASSSLSNKETVSEVPEPSLIARILCCRKSKRQTELKIKRENMYQRVEESIDVINMVRDFNYLKILVHFMFKKQHINTAQLVGFALWNEELIMKDDIQRKIDEKLKKIPWSQSFDTEKQRVLLDNIYEFKRCIESVAKIKDAEDEMEQKQKDEYGRQIRKQVKQEMDRFFSDRINIGKQDIQYLDDHDASEVHNSSKSKRSIFITQPELNLDNEGKHKSNSVSEVKKVNSQQENKPGFPKVNHDTLKVTDERPHAKGPIISDFRKSKSVVGRTLIPILNAKSSTNIFNITGLDTFSSKRRKEEISKDIALRRKESKKKTTHYLNPTQPAHPLARRWPLNGAINTAG
jgi:hypothetical protein